jgi:hypothetical protein
VGATKKTARIAGMLYLLLVITGVFTLMYAGGKLAVQATPAETTANLLANESLLRIDLVVSFISLIIFVFVALALYQLLKEVHRPLAAIMVILVLIQIPGGFTSQILEFGALELARGSGPLSTIDQAQRESLAVLCLHMNNKDILLAHFLWGLWLFPLGILVYRSGFIPRILGGWLILNGAVYMAQYATGLFLPHYSATLFMIAIPALLGEIALTLWLLIVGIKCKDRVPLTPSGLLKKVRHAAWVYL